MVGIEVVVSGWEEEEGGVPSLFAGAAPPGAYSTTRIFCFFVGLALAWDDEEEEEEETWARRQGEVPFSSSSSLALEEVPSAPVPITLFPGRSTDGCGCGVADVSSTFTLRRASRMLGFNVGSFSFDAQRVPPSEPVGREEEEE